MQTAYLDHRGMSLDREGNTIVLRDHEGHRLGSLPGKNLERLILQGEMHCSTGAMAQLLENGTSILWLSARRSHRIASLQGGLASDARLRIMQYRCYEDPAFRQAMARRIVLAKLQGEQRNIAQWRKTERSAQRVLLQAQERIQHAIDSVPTVPDREGLMGIEGQAAQGYLQALFTQVPPAVSSTTRSRRPPRDPINALLSLGYTLAHHESVSAAYAAGLDPYLGFLHALAVGRESLGCDLTEFLRSLMDTFTVRILHEETLRAAHFTQDNGACLLGKQGRALYYRAWARIAPTLRRMARRYARWIAASIRESEVGAA